MEALTGWRILSAVDEIISGKYARTRAQNWVSEYAPEFLMIEMMAQTGGLIVGETRDFTGNVVFAKIETAEFQIPPFEMEKKELVIEAFARDGVGEQGSWIEAEVSCDSKPLASARLFLIDAGDLTATGKSVTFHHEFLSYYKIREKIKK